MIFPKYMSSPPWVIYPRLGSHTTVQTVLVYGGSLRLRGYPLPLLSQGWQTLNL